MKEQLIEFETAKLANSKKFNYKTNDYWISYASGKKFKLINNLALTSGLVVFSAPTQSLLQKWLREKHEINIEIGMQFEVWFFSINKIPYNSFDDSDLLGAAGFKSYEEALEKGLQEALKLIK